MVDGKRHWESVYGTKGPDEVSWSQEVPFTSLELIHSFGLDRTARIIDVGGGDSRLVDHLLDEGFRDITVLDISATALEKARERLGERAALVNWVVSDITAFNPQGSYDVWHDRATFHFLTTPEQVGRYMKTASRAVAGFMVIGTFSDRGPDKCSGLDVRRYSEEMLKKELEPGFSRIRCISEDHLTPFGSTQNFLFCSFRKKKDQPSIRCSC